MRPKFLHLLDEQRQKAIIQDVGDLIKVLGSKDVALDGRHTPALYSRFLSSLLAKHSCRPHSRSESPPNEPEFYPQYQADCQVTPPHTYSWPDIIHTEDTGSTSQHNGDFLTQGEIYQRSDTDMDLSLSHFLKTVTQGFPPQASGTQIMNCPESLSWEFGGTSSSQYPEFWNIQ